MSQLQAQSFSTPTATTSQAGTLTNPVNKGSALFVASYDNNGAVNTISSITDTAGNTWARAVAATEGSFVDVELWYTINKLDGANTVTVNYGASITPAIVIAEYSDKLVTDVPATAGAANDVTATGNSITGTAMATAATSAPTQGRELVICAGGSNGISSTTFSAGAGFANLVQKTDATSGAMVGLEDARIDAKIAQTGLMTISGSGHWAIVIATFKLANTPFSNRGTRPHIFSPGIAR